MRERILKAYYMGTPAFVLLDYVCGGNVRAVGFESYPMLKFAYYGLCMGCFALIYRFPTWTSLIAMLESGINVGVLVVSFLGPYFKWIGSLEDLAHTTPPLSTSAVANFFIAGMAASIAFHSYSRPGQADSGFDMRGMRK